MNYSNRKDETVRCVVYRSDRAIEWACSAIILGFAITCFIWPRTIEVGAFRYILTTGLTPEFFTWFCLLIGSVRCGALWFNGRGLPWSARIRAITAIFGGIIFGVMAWCLAFLIKDTGQLSLSVVVFIVLAGIEVYTTLRAGADVNEKTAKAANGNGDAERTIVARIITNDTTDSEASGLSAIGNSDHPGPGRVW